jgi:hypothetical protein
MTVPILKETSVSTLTLVLWTMSIFLIGMGITCLLEEEAQTGWKLCLLAIIVFPPLSCFIGELVLRLIPFRQLQLRRVTRGYPLVFAATTFLIVSYNMLAESSYSSYPSPPPITKSEEVLSSNRSKPIVTIGMSKAAADSTVTQFINQYGGSYNCASFPEDQNYQMCIYLGSETLEFHVEFGSVVKVF